MLPCHGHITAPSSISPSESGPPSWVHVAPSARYRPPRLATTISSPSTVAAIRSPSAISSTRATVTHSDTRCLLTDAARVSLLRERQPLRDRARLRFGRAARLTCGRLRSYAAEGAIAGEALGGRCGGGSVVPGGR